MLDLAIIIPQVTSYGGAELFALECIRRWQYRQQITLYTTQVNQALLTELEIDPRMVQIVQLSTGFTVKLESRPVGFGLSRARCL